MRRVRPSNSKMAKVDKVSKLYRGDGRSALAHAVLGGLLGGKRPYQENWALRAGSFWAILGESPGVVGGNGAGKSTLLKIVAGIAPSPSGKVRVRGANVSQL